MPMKTRPRLLAAGLAALLLAAPATAPLAQTSSTQTAPAASANFSQEELETFAAASLEVERVSAKWEPRIASAPTEAEQNQVREEAMGELVEVVQDEGLTVDRYNQIAMAVQSNPEVAQTVQQLRSARQ
jgi:hypothetical protein